MCHNEQAVVLHAEAVSSYLRQPCCDKNEAVTTEVKEQGMKQKQQTK